MQPFSNLTSLPWRYWGCVLALVQIVLAMMLLPRFDTSDAWRMSVICGKAAIFVLHVGFCLAYESEAGSYILLGFAISAFSDIVATATLGDAREVAYDPAT